MRPADPASIDATYLDRAGARGDPALWSTSSDEAMVSSAHYRATAAGVEIIRAGGNAFDALAATSLALAVCEPAGSGLGGMAIATSHHAATERTFVVAGACRAPAGATPQEVARSHRYAGHRAVAVPTYLSVIQHLLARYGTMSAAEVMAPAYRLASEGFRATPMFVRLVAEYGGRLDPSATEVFFDAGAPVRAGQIVRQPALARTLERLSTAGLRDFYEGEIADRIAADMAAHGGWVDRADLASVPAPDESAPTTTRFYGQEVHTAGPPAGGVALLEALNLHQALAEDDFQLDTAQGVSRVAAIIRRVRADRRRYRKQRPEDPDLTSEAYARAIAGSLGETSHTSIVDGAGNAVALTQSLERSFGAKVMAADLGFLYNGYLRGFKVEAKDHPYYLRPGAVARSNAAPTIVLSGGRPVVVIGSTGSERMVSSIYQVLVRLGTQPPFAAVEAPRLHVSPDGLALVEGRWPLAADTLRDGGYTVVQLEPYSFKVGGLHAVVRREAQWIGVAEPRRDGAAWGP